MSLMIEKIPQYFGSHYSRNNLIRRWRYVCLGQKILKIRLVTMWIQTSQVEKSRKRKKVLTGDSELNLFGDDGSNAVFGIASIVSRVRSADWLYFVEMFGREIWQKDAIFHPTILHLRKTCKKAIKTLTICWLYYIACSVHDLFWQNAQMDGSTKTRYIRPLFISWMRNHDYFLLPFQP